MVITLDIPSKKVPIPSCLATDFDQILDCETPIASIKHYKNEGEHYALLRHLVNQIEGPATIVDMGTFNGLSALSLANNKNKVISYDITHQYLVQKIRSVKQNIDFRLKSASDVNELTDIVKSSIVFLDVDPHDGKIEKEILSNLLKMDYRGIIIADDIYLNREMLSWWLSIPLLKIDLTYTGHWSGTGIIVPPNCEVKLNIG